MLTNFWNRDHKIEVLERYILVHHRENSLAMTPIYKVFSSGDRASFLKGVQTMLDCHVEERRKDTQGN